MCHCFIGTRKPVCSGIKLYLCWHRSTCLYLGPVIKPSEPTGELSLATNQLCLRFYINTQWRNLHSNSDQGHSYFFYYSCYLWACPEAFCWSKQISSCALPPWLCPSVPLFFLLLLLVPGCAHSEHTLCSWRIGTVLWRHVTFPKAFDDFSRPPDDQFTWRKQEK